MIPIYRFSTIDSTNEEAKRKISEGLLNPFIILSCEQTAGRGRGDHTFYSPKGSGLYMTLAIPRPTFNPNEMTITGNAAAIVSKILFHTFGIQTDIKWVNDLYLNGRKVAGILSEFNPGCFLLIGIGINLFTESFPEELKEKAGALFSDSSHTFWGRIKRARWIRRYDLLAQRIGEEILTAIQNPEDTSYLTYYREHSMVLHRTITYMENGISEKGYVTDIDIKGRLVLDTDKGRVILSAGEISVD